ETIISSSTPAHLDQNGLGFTVRVEAHGQWATDIHVVTAMVAANEGRTVTKSEGAGRRARPNMERSLERWLDDAPRLESDSDPLKVTYHRSLVDLAALRFSPMSATGQSLPAAGLPWFMTMFGRDSLLTSLQALPFNSELAATTLRELGLRQGTRIDDFRDEDPGRI